MYTEMFAVAASALLLAGCCCSPEKKNSAEASDGKYAVRLITLDPGHFHAALVQKFANADISPVVHVYAPENGFDLQAHLKRIQEFNTREKDPTSWKEEVYTGKDFLQWMIAERKGNVVVLAGNNARKTEYILASVKAGFNVLADKPMAITPKDLELLREAYRVAKEKGVILYDIMTERYEITTMLQRELARDPELYGRQETGTQNDPAVTKESVHHFCKLVNGVPLQRPEWYYDTDQQGEAIVDVTTHLTDLVQWEVWPGVTLQPGDAKVLAARVWPTDITFAQYQKNTSAKAWPPYLKSKLDKDGNLPCMANGEYTWNLKGVFAKVSVLWNFEPEAGSGDTHYSLMRGTKCSLVIEQGQAEGFKPVLYVEPRRNVPGVTRETVGAALKNAVAKLQSTWPGVSYEPFETGFRINVPAKYHNGHEQHFAQVMAKYIGFIKDPKSMPAWEIPDILVKYQTLMDAYKKSRE